MNKVRYMVLLALLMSVASVSAQTYEDVLRRNFWNGSKNIAGIRQDSLSRSYAEISGCYEGGGFRDTWQAEEGWSAGAATASIRHMERMSLKGSFSFEQTEGYGMCGSMFIDPGYYPVDVLEFTPGRKTLQTYAFDGGLSYDLSDTWRIGAVIGFESSNIAKRKDLRHTNWKLDIDIAPGFTFSKGDIVIGASPIFGKTSEMINAEQVGTSESSYYAFFDKGLMYGVHQVWTGSGVHLDEAGVNGLPVKEFHYGGAFQMQYKGFFAEAEYLRTSGSVGEKEYIWFRFPGNSVAARLGYMHNSGRNSHYARLGFTWKGRTMTESVLEKVSSDGVTTVINHGANRISAESGWSLMPEYEFVSDGFELMAGAEISVQDRMASQMYPYVLEQSLFTYGAGLKAEIHIGVFDLGVNAGFEGGEVAEDGWLSSEDTGVQSSPYRLQDWYDRQMEYMTSFRTNAGLSLRWNFSKGMYAEAAGGWIHGFGLDLIGSPDRFTASLKLGYNF